MSHSPRATAGVLLLAALVACGGSPAAAPAGSTKVTMSEFKFEPAKFEVKSGKVVLFLSNSGGSAHDLVVTDPSGKVIAKSPLVGGGETKVFTIDNLGAGTYAFLCDVPGHRESGMQGSLTATS